MAVQLDPSIIGRATQQTVPLNSLASIYSDAAGIRQHQLQGDKLQEDQRQKKLLNDAYAAATNPDGSVDEGRLSAYLAQNEGGANIPGIQKASLGLQKERADVNDKVAGTQKTVQETLYKALDLTNNTIASLASNPATTEREVYAAMGNLVNAGAFNAQAQQQQTDPDTYARNLLSTMPVGNPQALRGWLIQQGSRVADATERLKLSLPKYDEQDRGGAINEGTINQMTGQRTAGASVGKTSTPGELLSAETSRRGQDRQDLRMGEANAINKEAARSQVIETPGGFAVVDKGNATSRPVINATGDQLVPANSQYAKDIKGAKNLSTLIPMAEKILKDGPTASGFGNNVDKAASFFGKATEGAKLASQLDVVGNTMVMNVPRFEGPQSDADRAYYTASVGNITDRSLPVGVRLASLRTLKDFLKTKFGEGEIPTLDKPSTGNAPRDRRAGDRQRPSLDSIFGGP